MIKAIETQYKGCRFRSRLEARWAVFFDALGVKWEYEKEGFDLDGLWYLPDFWLPTEGLWVEIKGQLPTEEELDKCSLLAANGTDPVALFAGTIGYEDNGDPYIGHYQHPLPHHTVDLFFGYQIPNQSLGVQDWHGDYYFGADSMLSDFLRGHGYDAPDFDGTSGTLRKLIEMDQDYYFKKYGRPHPKWRNGRASGDWGLDFQNGRLSFTWLHKGAIPLHCQAVLTAYDAARAARFEYGESG